MALRESRPYVIAGLMTAFVLVAGLPLPAAGGHPLCEEAPATTCAVVKFHSTYDNDTQTCTVSWEIRVIGDSDLFDYNWNMKALHLDGNEELNRFQESKSGDDGPVDETRQKTWFLDRLDELRLSAWIGNDDNPDDEDSDSTSYDCGSGGNDHGAQVPAP